MIKRILNPAEFAKAIDDIHALFKAADEKFAHPHLRHDRDSIVNNFGNAYLLTWDVFCWANFTDEKCDAIIIFLNEKNPKFGVTIFNEFLWLSSNPKVGMKLLNEALTFAESKDFKVIAMSLVENMPHSTQLKRIYKKLGFSKDTETWTKKL